MDGPLSLSLSPFEGAEGRERGRFRGSKRESIRGILSPLEGERERERGPSISNRGSWGGGKRWPALEQLWHSGRSEVAPLAQLTKRHRFRLAQSFTENPSDYAPPGLRWSRIIRPLLGHGDEAPFECWCLWLFPTDISTPYWLICIQQPRCLCVYTCWGQWHSYLGHSQKSYRPSKSSMSSPPRREGVWSASANFPLSPAC